jgi:hypothetical protein
MASTPPGLVAWKMSARFFSATPWRTQPCMPARQQHEVELVSRQRRGILAPRELVHLAVHLFVGELVLNASLPAVA